MLIPLWVVGFAVLAGYLAEVRSRSVTRWSAYGAILGPLAAIIVWVAPPGRCGRCGTAVRGWSGTCDTCGADMREVAAARSTSAPPASPSWTTPASATPAAAGPVSAAPSIASARAAAIGDLTLSAGAPPPAPSLLAPSTMPAPAIRPALTPSNGTTLGATGYGGSKIATPASGSAAYRSTAYPGSASRSSGGAVDAPDITPVETYVRSMTAATTASPASTATTPPVDATTPPAAKPTARSKPRARSTSRKQAAAAAAAAAWQPIGSGVFVTGRVALQPGSRYVLEVDETRLRARGPVGITPSTVVLDRKLRTLDASSAGDRLVVDTLSRGSSNTLLIFMSVEPTTPDAMAAEIARRAGEQRAATT